MERQTKHRILGILVIIGLVVILLPLFQGGGDLSTNTALVQAPPFPDQPIQVNAETTQTIPLGADQTTTASNDDNNAPHPDDDIITATHPSIINDQQTPAASEPAAVEAENTTKSPEPASSNSTTAISMNTDADTIQIPLTHTDVVKSEMAVNKQKQSEELASNNVEVEKASRYRIIEGEKAASILQGSHTKRSRPVKTISMRTPNASKPLEAAKTTEVDRLSKLKSAAWVIQVGSYKNKANALRIVNQLRANGYRAFIQEISTGSGDDHTRVYVGPENKRTAARAIADRLQNEMHVDGIVISYQPLTL